MQMTEHFVVTGSAQGAVTHYLLPSLTPVNESRAPPPACAISRVWPQPGGVRCVFEDARRGVFLLNAAADGAVPLPDLEGAGAEEVVWDAADPRLFVVAADGALLAYFAGQPGPAGPGLRLLGRTPLPATHAPVACLHGAVACRLSSGVLDTVVLESHSALAGPIVGHGCGAASRVLLQRR